MRQDVRELSTWFVRRAAPLPLVAVPDYGFDTTKSPHYVPQSAGLGMGYRWTAGHATVDWARVALRVPAGCGIGTPLLVKGLIYGTVTSESIIVKAYKGLRNATDAVTFDTSNSTEQSSIAVAASLVEVTIAAITPTAGNQIVVIAFRPRTTADAHVTQDKVLLSVWLQ